MAIVQLFPLTLIDSVKTSAVKRWPQAEASIYFELDDALFTNPAHRLRIELSLSWDNGATFPYVDRTGFQGGRKGPNGEPPSVSLGPLKWTVNGVCAERRPTHVRFRATPLAGVFTVGLKADLDGD
jgi:hypothetical protein